MARKKAFQISSSLKRDLGDTFSAMLDERSSSDFEWIDIASILLDETNPRELCLSPNDFKVQITESGQFQTTLAIHEEDADRERKLNDVTSLTDLAVSVCTNGVLEAILVFREGDKYRLIAGERRLIASYIAACQRIPARIYKSKPKNTKTIQFIENVHRESLSPWEKVNNIRLIIDEEGIANENGKVAVRTLAEIAGISISQASVYLRILAAPDEIMSGLKDGSISSLDKAIAIINLGDAEKQSEAMAEDLSLSRLRELSRTKEKPKKQQNTSKGRPAKYISLGRTQSAEAVKEAIQRLVGYEHFTSITQETDWQNMSSISKAWNDAWKIMESEA